MKQIFKNRNNSNFYYLKELQWTNKAMKMNQLNQYIRNKNNFQGIDSINHLKEKSWNKRFIYDSIQNYDSSKDKNVMANLLGVDEMNCYHNAIKKNNLILKSFYSNNKSKKKLTEECGKTNIGINLNPLAKNLKKIKLMNNSFSTNKFITNKHITIESFDTNKNSMKKLNNNTTNINPDILIKLWDNLCIIPAYRELFNVILSQLSEERKKDICEREYMELNELKNNLQLLSTSVYYRLKILEELNNLNDKLGFVLKSKQTISNEIVLKKISKKIESLREHTINICFLMKKIKSKMNEVHQWGKFDLDSISEKYKFDKNYLIKMKEEMNIFKEGYAKYFFDFGEENDPFLLNTSKMSDNETKIQDPFFHYVPLSDEMREDINQCIYLIYQELIGYKNTSISENNFRGISPLKKYNYKEIDIKIYQKHNEIMGRNKIKILNNNLWRNEQISPNRTAYSEMAKPFKPIFSEKKTDDNINKENNYIKIHKYNKKDKNKDVDIEKNIIKNDINDKANKENDKNIDSEKNNIINNLNKNEDIKKNIEKNEYILNNEEKESQIFKEDNNNLINDIIKNNPDNIINNNSKEIKKEEIENKNQEDLNNSGSAIINKINEISSKNNNLNREDKDDSYENREENSEISDKDDGHENSNFKINKLNKSKSAITPIQSRNIKITIFNDDISVFSKDFYQYYFTSIPEEIKNMFQIENNITKNMTQDISPYLLVIFENVVFSREIDDSNWINYKNYILGICSFSYQYKNNKIKININHISISNTEEKINYEDIHYLFNEFIKYIKNNFYFDEIIIRYNTSKINEYILKLFLNEFNFVVITETENEENEEENENQNKDLSKSKEKNDLFNKMVYTNDSTKNRVNDLIKESILVYIGKNIFDILDVVLITNNTELISKEKGKNNETLLINNVMMKYLLDKKEKTNVNRIYSKLSNLDQLIKLFQLYNINKKEIPLSLAENRFDIISAVLNKSAFNNFFSNSEFFNNFNINNPNSYLDKNTGIYYNFIKVDKLLIFENEKHHIKIYHILNNNIGLFFCNTHEEFENYLNKNNIYIQINNIYKETIAMNKIQILSDKIIWLPCFEKYNHLRTLSNNSFGTIHEYVKISNNLINQPIREPLLIKNKHNKDKDQFKITPDLINDIIIDSNFCFGIVNNTNTLEKQLLEENTGNNNHKKDEPYIIFLSLIKQNDFIINNI